MKPQPIRVTISSIDIETSLPYQWALLKSYADEIHELTTSIKWEKPISLSIRDASAVIKDEKQFSKDYQLDHLHVLGLSCYTWSTYHQIRIAKLVKKQNPHCLIVAGGPDLAYTDPEIFKKIPEIDVFVKNDGEIPFRRILQNLSQGICSFHEIPGLIVLKDGKAHDTGTSELLKSFDISPWLQNRKTLEKIVRDLRGKSIPIRIAYETNRGCPYSCVYCNWGSNTNSKIRCFDLENIKKELQWFKEISVDKIFLADANLGMLPRDIEIAQWMSEMGTNKPAPDLLMFPAKKNPARVIDVAIKLYESGLLRFFPLGVQTTDPTTLKSIGRTNLKVSEHRHMVEKLKEKSVPIMAQLILGCPGDSVSSWRQSIADMFEIGIEEFHVFRFQILKNTPADHPSYREKWNIQTIKVERDIEGCTEEYISSTSTMTRDDYIEMELYFLVVNAIWKFKVVREVAIRLKEQEQISFRAFFDDIFDSFFTHEEFREAYYSINILRNCMRRHLIEKNQMLLDAHVIVKKGNQFKSYLHKYFLLRRLVLEENQTFEAEIREYLIGKYSVSLDTYQRQMQYAEVALPLMIP